MSICRRIPCSTGLSTWNGRHISSASADAAIRPRAKMVRSTLSNRKGKSRPVSSQLPGDRGKNWFPVTGVASSSVGGGSPSSVTPSRLPYRAASARSVS